MSKRYEANENETNRCLDITSRMTVRLGSTVNRGTHVGRRNAINTVNGVHRHHGHRGRGDRRRDFCIHLP